MQADDRAATVDDELALFGADFLAKLDRLDLVAKKVFRGLLRGEHSTARRGRGLEFADFRPYQHGDDIRYIDWNIFLRLDRLFLKLYASDEDLTLHLVLDTSASMAFGQPLKFNYARQLAATLAYIGLGNLDRVGLNGYAHDLQASLAPVRSKRQFGTVLNFLRQLHCAGSTRASVALRELALRLRSPSLVIVIADFLDASDCVTGLDALRHRGHEVVALQLLSEDEIDPPLNGALRLVDAEDGSELRLTVDEPLRSLYRARLTEQLTLLEQHCRRTGIEYLRASTAVPFDDVVLKYLRRGTHLR